MADPVSDAADGVAKASRGFFGGIKSMFNSIANIIKPVLTVGAILTISAALGGGGIETLANVGPDGPGVTDMLKVPIEGFMEFTGKIGEVATSLSGGTESVLQNQLGA